MTSQEDAARSLNVPAIWPSVVTMVNPVRAQAIARDLLEGPLPRRWVHVQGVAATALTLAGLLGQDCGLVASAAWLHDIGYGPALTVTGFHPLDGARYLRDSHRADDVLCRLVAHHSCALIEAAERGLDDELRRDFPEPASDLADALIYCDMTTGPDGQRMTVDQRITEIQARYAPGDPVSRALAKSAPQLRAAVTRVAKARPSHAPGGGGNDGALGTGQAGAAARHRPDGSGVPITQQADDGMDGSWVKGMPRCCACHRSSRVPGMHWGAG